MDRDVGSKSHAKQIPGRNMQQYAAMNLIAPTTIPVMVPDPALTRNPNPTQTRTTGSNPNPNPNNEPHAHQEAVQPRAAAAREQDQYLPIANVIRIMRRILPPHAKISDEAKETVQECVSEYISFITGEANDRCRREQRKTVTAEDVLWAMTKLGFDSYIAPLSLYLSRYRDLETSGGTLEVPVTGKRRAAEYPPLVPVAAAPANYYSPSSPAAFPVMFYNPMTATSSTLGAGDYLMMPPDVAGSGGGGSTSGQEFGGPVMASNFDPFGQFK